MLKSKRKRIFFFPILPKPEMIRGHEIYLVW